MSRSFLKTEDNNNQHKIINLLHGKYKEQSRGKERKKEKKRRKKIQYQIQYFFKSVDFFSCDFVVVLL